MIEQLDPEAERDVVKRHLQSIADGSLESIGRWYHPNAIVRRPASTLIGQEAIVEHLKNVVPRFASADFSYEAQPPADCHDPECTVVDWRFREGDRVLAAGHDHYYVRGGEILFQTVMSVTDGPTTTSS